MNVFSAFNGMSCGNLAIDKLGLPLEAYYASEVNKAAIRATQNYFPKTKHVGDVTKVVAADYPPIDLLLGGSPCQGFSMAGKQLNFNDHRSVLFFEFVRLLKELKPKFWLLENVVMAQKHQDVISEFLGRKPIRLNSSLVSGQNRARLYWTNLPIPAAIQDRGVKFFGNPAAARGRKATIIGRKLDFRGVRVDGSDNKIVQCLEVRATNIHKSNCLTTVGKDNVITNLPPGRYPDAYGEEVRKHWRYLTLEECCELQTVPLDYFNPILTSNSDALHMLGNGWTVDMICEILKPLVKYYADRA